MRRRGLSVGSVVCGALVLVGCSGSGSSQSVSVSATRPKTTTTVRGAVPGAALPTAVAPSSAETTVPAALTPARSDAATVSAANTVLSTVARTASPTSAAARTVTKPNDNVHLGDSGPGVKQIQVALVAQGYKVGTDGQFGAQTQSAVEAFQGKNGLKKDGIVGPETWAKLQGPTSTTPTKATTTTVRSPTTTAKSTTTTTKR